MAYILIQQKTMGDEVKSAPAGWGRCDCGWAKCKKVVSRRTYYRHQLKYILDNHNKRQVHPGTMSVEDVSECEDDFFNDYDEPDEPDMPPPDILLSTVPTWKDRIFPEGTYEKNIIIFCGRILVGKNYVLFFVPKISKNFVRYLFGHRVKKKVQKKHLG